MNLTETKLIEMNHFLPRAAIIRATSELLKLLELLLWKIAWSKSIFFSMLPLI